MKTSCIRHPEKEPLVLIRAWHMKFCEGNKCAAALLNFFEYWHNIKLAMHAKGKKQNDVAEAYGDARTHDESLLQFHSQEDFGEGILGMFGKNTIIEALKFLENQGVITSTLNPNPRYRFDRTKYFLFHPEICNDWIDTVYLEGMSALRRDLQPQVLDNSHIPEINDRPFKSKQPSFKNKHSSFKNKRPSFKSKRSITETTTEITSEKTAASAQCEHTHSPTADTIAAADFIENVPCADSVIGARLTEQQERCVYRIVKMLFSQHSNAEVAVKVAEVTHTLCDTKAFSFAGQDFFKKLNTIQKMVREGKWTPPAALQIEKAHARDQECFALQQQLREHEGESQYLQEMITFCRKKKRYDTVSSFQEQLRHCKQSVQDIQKKMAQAEPAETTDSDGAAL